MDEQVTAYRVSGPGGRIVVANHSEAIRKIRKRLNLGQKWAWCTVRVSVSWSGYEASDYLGCCSYSNAKDFINNSGYYQQMLNDALEELNSKVSKSYATLQTLEGLTGV